jgi:hypothetical protein
LTIEITLDDNEDILSNPFLKEIIFNKKNDKKFDIHGCLLKKAYVNTAGTYTLQLVEDYIKFQ